MKHRHLTRLLLAPFSFIGLASCATGLRPYDSGAAYPARLRLLDDEVQRAGEFVSETAPAGIYIAAQENDDYVFYRGPQGIIERAYWNKPVAAQGGLALSKHKPREARLYTLGPGEGANLSHYVRARFEPMP
jgi:hypothetical protein